MIQYPADDQTSPSSDQSEPVHATRSMGHVLGDILGGPNIDLRAAARHLHVTRDALADIVQGKRDVSRRFVAERKWREVFAARYRAGWLSYGTEFERLVTDPPPRRKHPVRIAEPAHKFSFGHLLWLILGGQDADFGKAARRLDVALAHLTRLISGRGRVMPKTINGKHWRSVLAVHYPEGWARYAAAFDRLAVVDTKEIRSGYSTGWIAPEGCFGHVLWRILGGDNANISRASTLLGIAVPTLNNVIRGNVDTTQTIVAGKRWAEILASHYPELWEIHQAEFTRCVRRLRVHRPSRAQRPTNIGSFGYVVWMILGGEEIRVDKAAERLLVHASYLSAVLHGRTRPFQKTIRRKKWRETFARYYADAWKTYKNQFEEKARALRANRR